MDSSNPLSLSDIQRDHYADLFSSLDSDNLGKISYRKGVDVLNSSQLDDCILEKVLEQCGARRLGHFGRSQFYIALKLVACAQIGIPFSTEMQHIPMPSFLDPTNIDKSIEEKNVHINPPLYTNFNGKNNCIDGPILLPPPTKGNQTRQRQVNPKIGDIICSPKCENSHSNKDGTAASQGVDEIVKKSTEIVESPSSAIFEQNGKSWVEFQATPVIRNDPESLAYCEERHHLLDHEDDSSDNEVADSGVRGSGNEDIDTIWKVSSEQQEYYLKQFKLLQKDSSDRISGVVAKEFFEKSKLPQSELSKIWKLADIDKDGALISSEFCIAMHLVVLKRNRVDLPVSLPTSFLLPSASSPSFIARSKSKSPENGQKSTPNIKSNDLIPTLSPQSKQWTVFNDSPTKGLKNKLCAVLSSPPESNSVSTNMKPANFDFNVASIERDPKIHHPVALRVSPDCQVVPFPCTQPTVSTARSTYLTPHSAISHIPSGFEGPNLPPPPLRQKISGHVRSSSLDLDHLGKSFHNSISPDERARSLITSPNRISGPHVNLKNNGAFTEYRKHISSFSINSCIEYLKTKFPIPDDTPLPRNLTDPHELLTAFKQLQERSNALEAVNLELIHELAKTIQRNTS